MPRSRHPVSDHSTRRRSRPPARTPPGRPHRHRAMPTRTPSCSLRLPVQDMYLPARYRPMVHLNPRGFLPAHIGVTDVFTDRFARRDERARPGRIGRPYPLVSGRAAAGRESGDRRRRRRRDRHRAIVGGDRADRRSQGVPRARPDRPARRRVAAGRSREPQRHPRERQDGTRPVVAAVLGRHDRARSGRDPRRGDGRAA